MQEEAGRRIRSARETKGWTQAELAEAIGVSLRTVGNWERGEVQPPAIQLDRLVEFLGEGVRPIGNEPDAEVVADAAHPGSVKVSYGGHEVIVHPKPGTTPEQIRRLAPQIIDAVLQRIQEFESDEQNPTP